MMEKSKSFTQATAEEQIEALVRVFDAHPELAGLYEGLARKHEAELSDAALRLLIATPKGRA